MQNKKLGLFSLFVGLFFAGVSLQGMDEKNIEESQKWKDKQCREWKRGLELEVSETSLDLDELFELYDEKQNDHDTERITRLVDEVLREHKCSGADERSSADEYPSDEESE